MKTENTLPCDPVWANGVGIISNDECLPVIGNCQVNSILSTLDLQDKNFINNDVPMDIIILQNSGAKLSSVEINAPQASNYMILKDDKFEQKTNLNIKSTDHSKNKPTNLEDLLYFVCNLCPFLCTSNEKISDHLKNAHSNKTERKQLQLKCPACQNIFYHKISLRSHLIHDHGVSNSDINQIIQAVVYYAKVKMKSDEKKNLKQKSKESLKGGRILPQKLPKIDDANSNLNRISLVANMNNSLETVKLSGEQIPENVDSNETIKNYDVGKKTHSSTLLISNLVQNKKVLCLFPLCRVKMNDVNKLQYHLKSHVETGFKCLECEQTFLSWNSLAGHLWRSHKIDMELHCCSECDYRTFSLAKLNNIHKLIHTDVRNFICNICQKGFKNNKQLRNHKAIHKDKSLKSIPSCDICLKKFSDKRQVKLHMDRVHNKLKPFLCNFCGYKSSSRSSLKMHIRQHTGEKPFSCDRCSFTTADHNSLRRHKLRHTGDKPYKCAYCSYACIQSSTYKIHLKTKHPGQESDLMFTCLECQFRSVNKDKYLTHMVNIHKQRPSQVISEGSTLPQRRNHS